jgi:hypothetical protein
MSRRAQQLHASADSQVAELTERLSAAGEAGLVRPCPRRERLGDGTVGAVAAHTIDNYHQIARFVAASRDGAEEHHAGEHPAGRRGADVELGALLAWLASARAALATIGQLSDEQLDSVPPAREARFADGARTLEQIVASMLKHQCHQVDALTAALS